MGFCPQPGRLRLRAAAGGPGGDPVINLRLLAADELEAIDQAMAASPDVIVMDIRMPRLDGIEATRRLVSDERVRSRVLILTTFDEDEYVYGALRPGGGSRLRVRPGPAGRR